MALSSQAPGYPGHWLQTRSPWKRTITLMVVHPITNTRTNPKVQPQNKDFQQSWGKVWNKGFILEKLFQKDDVVTLLSTEMCLYSLAFALYLESMGTEEHFSQKHLLKCGCSYLLQHVHPDGSHTCGFPPPFPLPQLPWVFSPPMGTTGMHAL